MSLFLTSSQVKVFAKYFACPLSWDYRLRLSVKILNIHLSHYIDYGQNASAQRGFFAKYLISTSVNADVLTCEHSPRILIQY